MGEFLDRKVDQLSGGERTRLVLFTVLASESDLVLLDEPTNHLDMASITKLTGLFEKYKRAGVSVVSVSHVDWFLRQSGQDGVVEIVKEGEEREVKQSGASYANYTYKLNQVLLNKSKLDKIADQYFLKYRLNNGRTIFLSSTI